MPGTEIANETVNRGYDLPHLTNKLSFDVARIINALTAIDSDVAGLISSLAAKAELVSPAFSGVPTAPTPSTLDDSNQIATTAFVQALLDAFDTTGFAPINNPTFTGDPKAPTRTAGDSSTSIATTAFVDAVKVALLNSAPTSLDTLGELAAAIGNDPAFASTVSANIAAAIAQIPDYVVGLTAVHNVTTPNYYIDVQPGECRFGSKKAVLAGVMTKRLNTAWSEGNNGGAIDTGAITASKTYHWYTLRKLSDTSITDFIASLSATSGGVAVPSGWEILPDSRIFSTMTTSGNVIRWFRQTGNRVKLDTYVLEFTSTTFDNNNYNPVGLPDGISVDGEFVLDLSVQSNSSAQFQADSDKLAGSLGALMLHINVASPVTLRVGGKVRTREDGLMWTKSQLFVGALNNATLYAIGYNDYTVPRKKG